MSTKRVGSPSAPHLQFIAGLSGQLAKARKQEAERKENERQIGKQVNDYKAAVLSGSPWSDNLAQLSAR